MRVFEQVAEFQPMTPKEKSVLRLRCESEFTEGCNLAGRACDRFAMGLISTVQLVGHALLRHLDRLHRFFEAKR